MASTGFDQLCDSRPRSQIVDACRRSCQLHATDLRELDPARRNHSVRSSLPPAHDGVEVGQLPSCGGPGRLWRNGMMTFERTPGGCGDTHVGTV